jgi:hypothetical protein
VPKGEGRYCGAKRERISKLEVQQGQQRLGALMRTISRMAIKRARRLTRALPGCQMS